MTNYDYIISLPPEVLYKFLNCNACTKNHWDEEQKQCFSPSCCDEQISWLKKERSQNGITKNN